MMVSVGETIQLLSPAIEMVSELSPAANGTAITPLLTLKPLTP